MSSSMSVESSVWLHLRDDAGAARMSVRVPENVLLEGDSLARTTSFSQSMTDMEVLGSFMATVLESTRNDTIKTMRRAKSNQSLSSAHSTLQEKESAGVSARLELLRVVVQEFYQRFTKTTDIHELVASSDMGEEILKAYNQASSTVWAEIPDKELPALFEMTSENEAGLFALFGGQGISCLSELRRMYEVYPSSHTLIHMAARTLQQEEGAVGSLGVLPHGFDLMRWLQRPEDSPTEDYIVSAPVSYPLIGLTQLVNYYVTLRNIGATGDLTRFFKGATGHSQGVVSAITLSCSSTFEELEENSRKAVLYLFWQGVRFQQAFPSVTLHPDIVRESKELGDGIPTPMMACNGLPTATVEKYVAGANKKLPKSRQLAVALVNGDDRTVVAGHPESVFLLKQALQREAPKEENQARVPFSQRKRPFKTAFLSVTVPFHTPAMTDVVDIVLKDLDRLNINWETTELHVPVYSTFDGSDLRKSKDLMKDLAVMQCAQPVLWAKAMSAATVDAGCTHVVDFGPNGLRGAASFTSAMMEGSGVQVVLATSMEHNRRLADCTVLYKNNRASVTFAPHWARDFKPKLVRLKDGRVMLDTRFSRLTGKPPVIVAGMTPTTVSHEFVAAITNAGYLGELAGGGLPRPQIYRDAVSSLAKLIQPGEGIHINLLFLNPKLWGFQYPLVEVLRKEGQPVESITVAAGVPTLEKANEVLQNLHASGVRFVTFKPGSVDAIRSVLEIADANPQMSVVIQWTGGRAGGHHSFEDMHEPILECYGDIRRTKNVVILAGSGMGDAENSAKYLTGEWSVQFGRPPMPFDGILIASRAMVAAEAKTAQEVKDMIVATPGIENEKEWEKSYTDEAGGILTVNSELGEPIHKICNRGMRLWREFDKKFFALPNDKQTEAVMKNKDYIIQRINDDYQKVYFGQKLDGSACDVQDMTYFEVLKRCIDIMFFNHENVDRRRWFHESFRDRTYDFFVRTEERFCKEKGKEALFQSAKILDKEPKKALEDFFAAYPGARDCPVASADVDYFIERARGPGKPVNFIPLIDKDFKTWFKKDSLWYSEDLEAVPDQDPGRVCCLQGPVAARFADKSTEPIKDLLDRMHNGLVEHVMKREYASESAVPAIEYIGAPKSTIVTAEDMPSVRLSEEFTKGGRLVTAFLSDEQEFLPDANTWREFLAGNELSWLRAMMTADRVVRGKAKVENRLIDVFAPRINQVAKVFYGEDVTKSYVHIFHTLDDAEPSLKVEMGDDSIICITINHFRPATTQNPSAATVPLVMKFRYNPMQGYSPIHEIADDREDRIREFYGKIWFSDAAAMKCTIKDTFTSTHKLTRDDIVAFSTAIGNRGAQYIDERRPKVQAPMDMAIVAGWSSLIKTIFPKEIGGDLLRLVHLRNTFRLMNPVQVKEGDDVVSTFKVDQVVNEVDINGKRIVATGTLSVGGQEWMEIGSEFLIRGVFRDFENTFRKSQEKRVVMLKDEHAVGILRSKEWLHLDDHIELEEGDEITFDVEIRDTFVDGKKLKETTAAGFAFRAGAKIGGVTCTHEKVLANPVLAYLQRHGVKSTLATFFENGGYTILREADVVNAPASNDQYAVASLDLNPIHVNPYIADFAELPATITHGMWTSANARRVVETHVAKNNASRVKSYTAEFVGMVKPGTTLYTQLAHVGVKNGNLVIEAITVDESGSTVLKASAEVNQPPTAYVFTGQGSAEPGMGMDLYASSPAARDVWDTADAYFMANYGFSILDIVRKNPMSHTIYFGGPKGAKLRENYRSLQQRREFVENGETVERMVPIFPEIQENTESYTFFAPKGLLFATQFTQPALSLMEKAALEDMASKGLVAPAAMYAGHSLGEYAALSSIANIMTIEDLCRLIFLRGMTMQMAVSRDSKGRSNYGMVAANPSRVHGKFSQDDLHKVVDCVSAAGTDGMDSLVQVVNYNIRNRQYVIAGDNVSLEALSMVLTAIKQDPAKMADLEPVVQTCMSTAVKKREAAPDGFLALERGTSTIPLVGIDVPFHSRRLLGGVAAFRSTLLQGIKKDRLQMSSLVGRYVPNVTAEVFELTKEYVSRVFDATKSPVLEEILNNWEEQAKDIKAIGHSLLVELLAYQFASPVRWIETQDVFFGRQMERVIEVGPAATLVNMAKATLASGAHPSLTARELYSYHSDRDYIYYDIDNNGPTAEEAASAAGAAKAKPAVEAAPSPAKAAPAPVAAAPAPVAAAPAPAPAPAAAAGPVSDAPVSPLETLQVLLALKLKKPLADVKAEQSIKEMVGGKSAVQNEILGDLEKEFGKGVDNAGEMPISQLATAMGASYKGLGKFSSGLVSKMLGGKMPGGMGASQVKAYLSGDYGLGEGRVEGVLLHSLTMEPASRLGSEGDAKGWLDSVTSAYASKVGVSIGKGSAAPAAAAAAPVMAAAPSGPAAAPVADQPLSALDTMRALLALKLKVSLAEVKPEASIKEMVGGKSAVQNEILGDFEKEFGKAVDNAGDMPISQLASAMGGSYASMGKFSSGLVSKMLGGKMPGGVGPNQLRAHLSGERMLGEGRMDAVFVHALTMEPAGRLNSDAEAISWIDSVADSYGSAAGISVPRASQGGGGGGGAAGPAVSSEALKAMEKKMGVLFNDQVKAYFDYLGEDPLHYQRMAANEASIRQKVEDDYSAIIAEHGEFYAQGIKPVFTAVKERHFDAFWNLSYVDALELYHDIRSGRRGYRDPSSCEVRSRLLNRATPELVALVEHYVAKAGADDVPRLSRATNLLLEDLKACLDLPPVYHELSKPTAPFAEVSEDGKIVYKEIAREEVSNFQEYVEEMKRGSALLAEPEAETTGAASDKQRVAATKKDPKQKPNLHARMMAAKRLDKKAKAAGSKRKNMPFLYVKKAAAGDPNSHVFDPDGTNTYLTTLEKMSNEGVTYKGKAALVTGCGKGSIGIEVIKCLLAGGATVIATTSSFSKNTCKFFQETYEKNCGKGSKLYVYPFNQASNQDINALVSHIYDVLKLDLDFVLPFAALSENGRDIGGIDSRSELAHRIMLTNTVRLVGTVKNAKEARGIVTRPALVVLPLSPNHGLFGYDGLYSESKIALETMVNKWSSEGLQDYISIAGAVIGWTRGTGLMSANNLVSPGIEDLGCRTFTPREMAFNLAALMHPSMVTMSQMCPVWADLSGGMQAIEDLKDTTTLLRTTLEHEAAVRRAVVADTIADRTAVLGKEPAPKKVSPRANLAPEFPKLPSKERLASLSYLKGMVDPSRVVVVTGFGELGPYGNARTRWEMEAFGEFSLEGCIELAWVMGLIKYANGTWTDAESGEAVPDVEVKARYEETILGHTGVRIIEPELFRGYTPEKKFHMHAVALDRDMAPIEVQDAEEAANFKSEHGDNVDTYERNGQWYVKMKKGAVLHVPKALKFDRFVAGQVPTGWSPEVLGLPNDIITQVDPVTLYSLASCMDAFVSAGVSDPYEFYEYVHVSEVGNSAGGGMGGMRSLRKTFRERIFNDAESIQGDILQETFINTTAAWMNLLLLSSSGPIKTPVGACATAAESVEIGVETIMSGKAKVMVVGGFDDFGEEGSNEFASMKATSNNADEVAKGREPKEMSRPCATSRAGFMESQGAAVQLLMAGDLAIKMGVPIYAICAMTTTATDKEGRSIPAPGQGIMTAARELPGAARSPLLNISYRRKNLDRELRHIKDWLETEMETIMQEAEELKKLTGKDKDTEDYLEERKLFLEQEEQRMRRSALMRWGNSFYVDNPQISPIRGALAVYGLSPDDIDVATFHGTGTKANDKNESEVINKQLEHLGRSKGNKVAVICQKWLTGHPKGAAAGWMFNGVMQAMHAGIVPGNRNADNVDPDLRRFEFLSYPNRTIATDTFKAALITSFGFGQAGAELMIINPEFFLATLDESELDTYMMRRAAREQKSYRYLNESVTGKRKYIEVKTSAPYSKKSEQDVYLDPSARASYDSKTDTWGVKDNTANRFPKARVPVSTKLEVTMREVAEGLREPGDRGIGVDLEPIESINVQNNTFISRNFTDSEIAYCNSAPVDSQQRYAGRWAAKEAVIKAISNSSPDSRSLWKGAAAPLVDIEILPSESGAPIVRLNGHASSVASSLGITDIKVTISHGGAYAVAQAVAR